MTKIIEVKDYEILWKISRLIDAGEFKVDYTADDFFRYLLKEIEETKKIKVFAYVSPDEKNIKGLIIVSMTRDLVRDVAQLFIDLAWVDKDAEKEVGPALLERAEDYARELNISEVTGYSNKGEKSMLQRYGFNKHYTVYLKNISPKEEGQGNVIRQTEERGDQTSNSFRAQRERGALEANIAA